MIKAEFFVTNRRCLFSHSQYLFSQRRFSDPEIANFISYRFLAVMILAFPLGSSLKEKYSNLSLWWVVWVFQP